MQNYVSRELTHFVGRSLPDDAARYELLVRILRSGTLLDPQYMNREATPIVYFDMASEDGSVRRLNYYSRPKFQVRPHGSVDTNEFVAPEIVCFCDIPLDQLHVHTAKYSPFGLAFEKAFLIARGAKPVWYVATSAATPLAPMAACSITSSRVQVEAPSSSG